MQFFNNPNDDLVCKRVKVLDEQVVKEREEEYSKWEHFVDVKGDDFPLADFVYANLCDALPVLKNHTLEILWIACCSDCELYEELLGYSNKFLERRMPKQKNILRVDLAQFITEVAETIQNEMGNDAERYKIQFQEYLSHQDDRAVALPGKEFLEEFRKKIHVLYYLPPNNCAIPYFLQVQPNFTDLCQHSIIRHVCRAPDKFPKETPDVYEWMHVLEFVRHIGIQPYSLQGNLHMMNSKQEWPGFLRVFEELFPDKSVSIEERFLQLLTIYHKKWPLIWTLMGWRMNRQETKIVENFLHEFPKVFYQQHYVKELFHLIV